MAIAFKDLPPNIQEDLRKRGLAPESPAPAAKRQNAPTMEQKAAEVLASRILAFWLKWCRVWGIVGAVLTGITITGIGLSVLWFLRKGD